MSDKITYEELLDQETKKYPTLLIWGNTTKIIALIPAVLYVLILALVSIEAPEEVSAYTLKGFLYFACYGGFLKTIFELEKIDAFVVVFGLGTLIMFVNNLFYTGMASVIGVIIDMVIVWIAICIYNYKKARNDASMRAFEVNRYQTTRKIEAADKEAAQAKAEAALKAQQIKKENEKRVAESATSGASFSKAFEEFQKKNG